MGSYDGDNYAPWRDSEITEVIIQNGVTTVGKYAFEYCCDLNKVTIGNSVKGIAIGAFYDCEKLKTVTLPDAVTIIADSAFASCTNLTSINIPNGVTSIGGSAFSGCRSLNQINIPDSVTEIESYAFCGCSNLKSVKISGSVTKIQYETFYDCTSLTSVMIPDSVDTIDDGAFSGCTRLTSVTIPDSVRDIYSYAFYNCPMLKSVTIPASVNNIGLEAFGYYRDEDFGREMKVDGFTIYGYDGYYDEWGGYYQSAARYYAEENGFTFVSLGGATAPTEPHVEYPTSEPTPTEPSPSYPDGYIYFDAASAGWEDASYVMFEICEVTENGFRILVPWGSKRARGTEGENHIWSYNAGALGVVEGKMYFVVFYNDADEQTYDLFLNTDCFNDTAYCDGTRKPIPYDPDHTLLAVKWENSNPSASGVAGDCTWMVEDTVLTVSGNGRMSTLIGGHSSAQSLWSYFDINEAVIEDGVTTICRDAFAGCSELETITISNSVMGIGMEAFYNCPKLTDVTLPESVEIIGSYAFCGCSGLTNITIPDSVTDIGENAFYNCQKLKRVTIPASVTNIDTKAFGYYWDDDFGLRRKVPGFTICGDIGSEAQKYAKNNNIPFERAIAMTGDADGDGIVTVLDVSEIQHSLALTNTQADEDLTKYGDVDQNGRLEIIDATWIHRYVAKIDIPYEVGHIIE